MICPGCIQCIRIQLIKVVTFPLFMMNVFDGTMQLKSRFL